MTRPRIINATHRACRALWVQCIKSPTQLDFATPREAQRAKFTMYDSVREERKTGEGEPAILAAIAEVEIAMTKDKCGIIVRPRVMNPLHNAIRATITNAIEGALIQPPAQTQAELDQAELSASLGKLAEKLKPGEGEVAASGSNPYYSRD